MKTSFQFALLAATVVIGASMSQAASVYSFETPDVGYYTYTPTTPDFVFSGYGGIGDEHGGTEIHNTPDGTQAAFLQAYGSNSANNGSMTTQFSVADTNPLRISFFAEARAMAGTQGGAAFDVIVDGVTHAFAAPVSSANFQQYSFQIPGLSPLGSHTLTFANVAANGPGVDQTTFIDAISVAAVPLPSSVWAGGALMAGLGGAAVIRKRREAMAV